MSGDKFELLTSLGNMSPEDFRGKEVERLKLVSAAQKVVDRLQTNTERIYDIAFTQPIVFAALQICVDLRLWEAWTAAGSSAKTVDELSKATKPEADPKLIRRLLRTSTPFSLALGDKKSLMPQSIQCGFSGFMTAVATYKLPWPEFFDTKSLVDGADLKDGGVLCVDIGGHHGVDLTRLLNKHPDLPAGSLVLEDLPEVVSGAESLNEKITILPHDMFKPQPVKESRAYYFHAVFHDWPDAVASKILKNVAAVMKKGYSKLLINDIVIPATGASVFQAAMDVEMMAFLCAYERTEAMWTNLLTSVGLKINKIWKDTIGNESLIEAELA